MAKRSLSMLLAVLMVLSLALPVYADGEPAVDEPAIEASAEPSEAPVEQNTGDETPTDAEPAPEAGPVEEPAPEAGPVEDPTPEAEDTVEPTEEPVPEETEAPAEEPAPEVTEAPAEEPVEETEIATIATDEVVTAADDVQKDVDYTETRPNEDYTAKTEKGLRFALGKLADATSTLSVTLGNNIRLTSALEIPAEEDKSVTLKLGANTLTGDVNVAGNLTIDGTSGSKIAGKVIVSGSLAFGTSAEVSINTLDIQAGAETEITISDSQKVSPATIYVSSGTLNINAATTVTNEAGGVQVSGTGVVNVTKALNASSKVAATVDGNGQLIVGDGGSVGKVVVKATAVKPTGEGKANLVVKAASETATVGAVEVNGGSAIVGDKGTADSVTVSGGEFKNEGEIKGALTVSGGTATLKGGTIFANATENDVPVTVNGGGTVNVTGDVTVSVTGTAANTTGIRVGSRGTLNILSGDTSVAKLYVAASGKPVEVMNGGTLNVGDATTKGTLSVAVAVAGGTMNVNNGEYNTGDVTITDGGTVNVEGKTADDTSATEPNGTVSGKITAKNGDVNVNGGTATEIEVATGTVTVNGGVAKKITVTASPKNAEILVKDGVVGDKDTDATAIDASNGGTVTISGGKVIAKGSTATVVVGKSNTTASLTVSGGEVGGATAISLVYGTAEISGDAEVTGDTAVEVSGGTATVKGEAVVRGATAAINATAGTVNVEGGTVTAKKAPATEGGAEQPGDGKAIVVNGTNTGKKATVNISGDAEVVGAGVASQPAIDVKVISGGTSELNIKGGSVTNKDAAAVSVESTGGEVNITDGTVKATSETDAITAVSVAGGEVTVKDKAQVTAEGTKKADATAIDATGGALNVEDDAQIKATSEKAAGVGINAGAATVKVKGGNVSATGKDAADKTKADGTGVKVVSGASVEISGGVIEGDKFGVDAGAAATIKGDAEVKGPTAVNVTGVKLTVEGGTIGTAEDTNIGINVTGNGASVEISDAKVLAKTADPGKDDTGKAKDENVGILVGTGANATVSEGATVSGYNGVTVNNNGANLTVDGGEVKGELYGVKVINSGSSDGITLSGGAINGGEAGVYMANGKATVSGKADISGEKAGVVAEGGTFEMTGGAVTGTAGAGIVARVLDTSVDTTAHVYGGDVKAGGTGTVTVGEAKFGGDKYTVPCAGVVKDSTGKGTLTVVVGENAKAEGPDVQAAKGEKAVTYTVNGQEPDTFDATNKAEQVINAGTFNSDVSDYLNDVVACVGVKHSDGKASFTVSDSATVKAGQDMIDAVTGDNLQAGDIVVLNKLPDNSDANYAPYKVDMAASKNATLDVAGVAAQGAAPSGKERRFVVNGEDEVEGKDLKDGLMFHPTKTHAIKELTKVAAKAAKCGVPGNIEYYVCEECGDYFKDANGQTPITDKNSVVEKALNHTSSKWYTSGGSHYQICDQCGTQFHEGAHKPGTVGHDANQHWTVCSECNEPYNYSKHSFVNGKCSVCGESQTVTPPAETKKPAPPQVTASYAKDGINIKWTAVEGAVTYRVYVREAGTKTWKTVGHNTNMNYTWRHGHDGKKYEFTVRAVKSKTAKPFDDGYKTSNAVQYVVAPQVTVKQAAKGIEITWSKVAGAQTYRVYYKVAGGKWQAIGHNVGPSYTWKHGTVGTNYQFTVRPCTVKGTTKSLLGTGYNTSETIKYAK